MARRKGQDITGVLLLDKPEGLSSNHALQRARRLFDAKKAGHTGTLDPFATGLLVCCFGKATKICAGMLNADKTYIATLQWGAETDSGDLTGAVVAQAPSGFSGISPEALANVLPQFLGQITQVPPMYSALKRDGKPLYAYAREGVEVERTPRQVRIDSLRVLSQTASQAVLEVACSKGTYIRTLAQDIGRALGCYAHLTALRRTRVGPFSLDQAHTLEALSTQAELTHYLRPLASLPLGLLPEKLQKEIA